MNKDHLFLLCSELELGSPVGESIRIYGSRGGSLMWKVNIEDSTYAIKQLSPAIDLTNEKIVRKYEMSEEIANQFSQQGIPAVFAISKSGKRLTLIEGTGYLIYPWIDGHILDQSEGSDFHAIKIAEILQKLHRINLNIPEVNLANFDIHSNEKIIEVISKTILFKCSFANILKKDQDFILSINDAYQSFVALLSENTVITHGDLNLLNVLWNNRNEPVLIDWESARRLNLTRDVVRTSIAWSGSAPTDEGALKMYSLMLETYSKAGGTLNIAHIAPSLHSIYGSQINWLLYNIELFLSSNASEEKTSAEKEINSVLMAMRKIESKMPVLLKI